jgi:hypothetical protein
MKPMIRPCMHTLCVATRAVAAAVWTVAAEAAPAVQAPLPALAAQAPEPAAGSGLVVVDQAALRAAPRDSAPLLVPLWRGEALQLRGIRGDWLQVWDAHRERGGFVRAAQVMPLGAGAAAVPDLAAQLRLLRQQPGAESLGIGVAAAIIERAEAAWLASPAGADVLDTLVVLQERLASRVQASTGAQQVAAAAHGDVARRYGFALREVTRSDGSLLSCPNAQPATLLRGHPAATPAKQARAAMALTRLDCLAPEPSASRQLALLDSQAAWLEGIDPAALLPTERNRLLLRRASVLARTAFARREGDARGTAAAALAAWSQLIPAELTDDDAPALREAAIRLSPLRWIVQPPVDARRLGRFDFRLDKGGPGETCLVWKGPSTADATRRCSHGVIHLASATLSPDGRTVALTVQPLDGWTELWRLDEAGQVQVLPPAGEAPGLGAVEWAGWAGSISGWQMLVAREAEAANRVVRRFEVYGPEFAQPVRWAADPAVLVAFQRSAEAGWRSFSPIAR